MSYSLPVILTIGGHDPSGGAGIQADIETITSHGCHAVSLITCLTSQNTKDFFKVDVLNPNIFNSQAESLLSDITIDAIKIGVIGNLKMLEEINKLLNKLEGVAVIFDPGIKSTSGGTLTESTLLESLKSLIFPKSFLVTPNIEELKSISGKRDLSSALEDLFSFSPKHILVKDVQKSKDHIINSLYTDNKLINSWINRKIEGSYHGTGSNLASSIACSIAKSKNIEESIKLAQEFTSKAIKNSIRVGKGQKILKGGNAENKT